MTTVDERRAATRSRVAAGSALTGSYLAMNAAATLIAGLGLLENSIAAIIGAMLIATLLGPIVGIALGLAEGDTKLLGRSLVSELAGVAWVLAIGVILGLAAHRLPIGNEVLARSSPNLLDLLIGVVGGVAAGYTMAAGGLSEVAVGVAIAISLVPPLASCGILLAHGLPELAKGAFLLFLANFSAITIGAMVVFWLAGHRARAPGPARDVLLPRVLSFLLLAALAVHFTLTFRRSVARSVLESGIRATLSREVAKLPGARLINVTLLSESGTTTALVVVRTPEPVAPAEVARLNDLIDQATGARIDLHVRSVLTTETTRQGFVHEAHVPPSEDPGMP
jgi:uncharacterized hydrophobic protein (TIGR00271 family)